MPAMTAPAAPESALPTRQQLKDLHTFIDGRAYHAIGPTIRVPGTPALLREDQSAVIRDAAQSVFATSQHLCRALWHHLDQPDPVPAAYAVWAALCALAAPWHNHPDLPEHLRSLFSPGLQQT